MTVLMPEDYEEMMRKRNAGTQPAPQPQAPNPSNPLVQMRGQVIKPTATGQETELQNRVAQGSRTLPQFNRVGAQRGNISPFQSVEAGGPLVSQFQGPAADVGSLRQSMVSQAQGLSSAPNRGELAARTFDLIRDRTRPQFQRELQNVGRKAAALGRIGAGMTTSNLGDVQSERERFLSQAQEGLSLNAAQQALQDRLGTLSALSNVQRGLFGQDISEGRARTATEQARASERAGLRGERRGERAARMQHELTDVGLGRDFRNEQRQERGQARDDALARYGLDMSSLNQIAGLNRGRRDELRGERGRADTLAEIANQRRIEQARTEAQLQNQLFNQLMGRAGMAGQLGFGGITPLDAIPGVSGEAGRQGQNFMDSGLQALQNFFMQRAQQAQTPQPVISSAPLPQPHVPQGGINATPSELFPNL